MMLEEGRVKSMLPSLSSPSSSSSLSASNPSSSASSASSSSDNAMVDTLLQQLNNGDLRTQVVKWQNACFNMHLAFREMVHARAAGALDGAAYARMARASCAKLCALPVCVGAWLFTHRPELPASGDPDELTGEFLRLAADGREEAAALGDMPHAKERTALMMTILGEMEEQVAETNMYIFFFLLTALYFEDTHDFYGFLC